MKRKPNYGGFQELDLGPVEEEITRVKVVEDHTPSLVWGLDEDYRPKPPRRAEQRDHLARLESRRA